MAAAATTSTCRSSSRGREAGLARVGSVSVAQGAVARDAPGLRVDGRAQVSRSWHRSHARGTRQPIPCRGVDDLTPSQKGAVAEAAVTAAAIQLGLTVLRPLCEGRRYDLVIDLEPELLRVQCKLARRVKGVLSVSLRTCRCTPRGYVRTSYSAAEIDAVAICSPELGRCFLVPIDEVSERRAMNLRLDPAANNQARGVKWARDYELMRGSQTWRRHPRPA